MENKTAARKTLSVLKNRSDFQKISKGGLKVRGEWLFLAYRRNEFGSLRCGWTLPRQVGSAVVRNKLKRWTRIYFREQELLGSTVDFDINVVFLKTPNDFYKKLDYERFAKQLDKALGVLRKRA